MRRRADPAPVVRLTVDRVVVRGAAAPPRAALAAAIEQAVRAEVAASPAAWTGAVDGWATATIRQSASGCSSNEVAGALASAISRGLGGRS